MLKFETAERCSIAPLFSEGRGRADWSSSKKRSKLAPQGLRPGNAQGQGRARRSMLAESPRCGVLLLLALDLVAVLIFAVPIWLAESGGEVPLAAIAALSGWSLGAVALVPVIVSPDNIGVCAALLVLLASTAMVAWVPVSVHLLLHDDAADTSWVSAGGVTLVALSAAPVVLMPALPLWTTLFPSLPSAAAFVIVVGVEADLDAGTIASIGSSLGIALVLLFYLGRARDGASRVADIIVAASLGRLPSVDKRRSSNSSSNSGSKVRGQTRRSSEGTEPADQKDILARRNTGVVGLARQTTARVSRYTARFSVVNNRNSENEAGSAHNAVDLRSNVDRARVALLALQPTLKRSLTKNVGNELSKVLSLLDQPNTTATTRFDFSSSLAGVDKETAAFLQNTLSTDHQRGVGRRSSSDGGASPGALDADERWVDELSARAEVIYKDLAESDRAAAAYALDEWDADMIRLDEESNGHALLLLGTECFRRHNLFAECGVQEQTLAAFLVAMEEGYGTNPYHNSIHSADVLLGTHLFLTKYNLTRRLSKANILAALVAAIIHDFNHPGTTNAFEVKTLSRLAITYSDRSPLENNHLASAFAVLNTTKLNVLAGLGSANFRSLRKLIIDIVLHTDLAKHFEFISKLQTLEASEAALRAIKISKGRESEEIRIAGNIASRRNSLMSSGTRRNSLTSATSRRNSVTMSAASRRNSVSVAPSGSSRRNSVFTQARQALTGGPAPPERQCRAHRSSSCMINNPSPEAGVPRVTEGSCLRRKSCSDAEVAANNINATAILEERRKRTSDVMGGLAAVAASKSDDESDANNESFQSDCAAALDEPEWSSPFLSEDKVDMETVLICAVKFADLGHCFKPWALHQNWTQRITEEFWLLGDREKSMGVPVGPLCDREADIDIPKSQGGFFQFICRPFYAAVAELVDPTGIFIQRCEGNASRWQAMHERTQAVHLKGGASTNIDDDPDTDSFDSSPRNRLSNSSKRRASDELTAASTASFSSGCPGSTAVSSMPPKAS